MVYEISHNLVQEESHPDLFRRPVWVHRKGATRALPAGHPMLAGTRWAGHRAIPCSSPGSMGDSSYVLRPAAGRGALPLLGEPRRAGGASRARRARREITQAAADKQHARPRA